MGTLFISLGFAALLLYSIFALLYRLYRWAFKQDGKSLTANHTELNEAADEVGKAARVLAFVGMVAASAVAPTGFAAIGAKMGLISMPLIVVVAPQLVGVAGVISVICCAVSLYTKGLRRKERAKQES